MTPLQPKLSFVSVNLNNSSGLIRTILSINKQTFRNWEHIVQDGGSTDLFWDVAAQFTDKLRYIKSQKDGGIYEAMNLAIDSVQGSFVWFINSGDELFDELTLSHVMESQQKFHWRCAYGSLAMLDDNLEVSRVTATRPVSPRKVLQGLENFPHPSTIYEVDTLRKIGKFRPEFGPAADQELMIRLGKHSEPYFIERVLARFEIGGSSKGHSQRSYENLFHKIRKAHLTLSAFNLSVNRIFMELRIIKALVRNIFKD